MTSTISKKPQSEDEAVKLRRMNSRSIIMKWGLLGWLAVLPALSAPPEGAGTNRVVTARVLKVSPAEFDLDRDGRLDRAERAAFRKRLEEARRASPSPAVTNAGPRKVTGARDRRAETIQRALAK